MVKKISSPNDSKLSINVLKSSRFYANKPIFRRKLIEKYSTARYNFNTKLVRMVKRKKIAKRKTHGNIECGKKAGQLKNYRRQQIIRKPKNDVVGLCEESRNVFPIKNLEKLKDECEPSLPIDIDMDSSEFEEKVKLLVSDLIQGTSTKMYNSDKNTTERQISQGLKRSSKETNSHDVKTNKSWKLVSQGIYDFLLEKHKAKDARKGVTKRRRIFGVKKRRKIELKKSDTEYVDPYVNCVVNSDHVRKPSGKQNQKYGIIMHLGVNRPLFPLIYRNLRSLNDNNDVKITDFWSTFALSTLIVNPEDRKSEPVLVPVKDSELLSLISDYETSCEPQQIGEVALLKSKTKKENDYVLDNKPLVGRRFQVSEEVAELKSTTKQENDKDLAISHLENQPLSKRKRKHTSELARLLSTNQPENCDNFDADFTKLENQPMANRRRQRKTLNSTGKCYEFCCDDKQVLFNDKPPVNKISHKSKKSVSFAPVDDVRVFGNSPPKIITLKEKLEEKSILKKFGHRECVVLIPKLSPELIELLKEGRNKNVEASLNKLCERNQVVVKQENVINIKQENVINIKQETNPVASDETENLVPNETPIVVKEALIHTDSNLSCVEDDSHFFGSVHCSRTFGEIINYVVRNRTIVYHYKIKKMLDFQKSNNKYFKICDYVRMKHADIDSLVDGSSLCVDVEEEFQADQKPLPNCDSKNNISFPSPPNSSNDSENFPNDKPYFSKNPNDILNNFRITEWKDKTVRIDLVKPELLKFASSYKWLSIKLDKSIATLTYANYHHLKHRLMFEILYRAELSKKIICNLIEIKKDLDELQFGIYSFPGLCEIIFIGPYLPHEEHKLVGTIREPTGKIIQVPVKTLEEKENFSETEQMQSFIGAKWWWPQKNNSERDTNEKYLQFLFDNTSMVSQQARKFSLSRILMEHDCWHYDSYIVAGKEHNFVLFHDENKPNGTITTCNTHHIKLSSVESQSNNFTTNLPHRRVSTKLPGYVFEELLGKSKEASETNTALPKKQNKSRKTRHPSFHIENERIRRLEFRNNKFELASVLRKGAPPPSNLPESINSILLKSVDMIKWLEGDTQKLMAEAKTLRLIQNAMMKKFLFLMKDVNRTHPNFANGLRFLNQWKRLKYAQRDKLYEILRSDQHIFEKIKPSELQILPKKARDLLQSSVNIPLDESDSSNTSTIVENGKKRRRKKSLGDVVTSLSDEPMVLSNSLQSSVAEDPLTKFSSQLRSTDEKDKEKIDHKSVEYFENGGTDAPISVNNNRSPTSVEDSTPYRTGLRLFPKKKIRKEIWTSGKKRRRRTLKLPVEHNSNDTIISNFSENQTNVDQPPRTIKRCKRRRKDMSTEQTSYGAFAEDNTSNNISSNQKDAQLGPYGVLTEHSYSFSPLAMPKNQSLNSNVNVRMRVGETSTSNPDKKLVFKRIYETKGNITNAKPAVEKVGNSKNEFYTMIQEKSPNHVCINIIENDKVFARLNIAKVNDPKDESAKNLTPENRNKLASLMQRIISKMQLSRIYEGIDLNDERSKMIEKIKLINKLKSVIAKFENGAKQDDLVQSLESIDISDDEVCNEDTTHREGIYIVPDNLVEENTNNDVEQSIDYENIDGDVAENTTVSTHDPLDNVVVERRFSISNVGGSGNIQERKKRPHLINGGKFLPLCPSSSSVLKNINIFPLTNTPAVTPVNSSKSDYITVRPKSLEHCSVPVRVKFVPNIISAPKTHISNGLLPNANNPYSLFNTSEKCEQNNRTSPLGDTSKPIWCSPRSMEDELVHSNDNTEAQIVLTDEENQEKLKTDDSEKPKSGEDLETDSNVEDSKGICIKSFARVDRFFTNIDKLLKLDD